MDTTDKVVTLIEECRELGLKVESPSVNTSHYKFTVKNDNAIFYGLGAVKGVGEGAIAGIIRSREQDGPFKDLFDFCQRIDLKKANRRTLEALIRAGALDDLGAAPGPNRATLMATLDTAVQMAEQRHKDAAAGQNDMFALMEPERAATGTFIDAPDWDDEIRLNGEKETLGLYLTGHPIDRYEAELAGIISHRICDLNPSGDQTIIVAGLVVAMRTMNTRRGDRMAFVTLDDRSGRLELAVFADTYQHYRDLLVKDRLVVVEGEVSVDDYSGGIKMSARKVYDIDNARESFAKRLVLTLNQGQTVNGFVQNLAQVLAPFREGRCAVRVEYRRPDARAQLTLGPDWRVRPTDELLRRITELAGEGSVRIEY